MMEGSAIVTSNGLRTHKKERILKMSEEKKYLDQIGTGRMVDNILRIIDDINNDIGVLFIDALTTPSQLGGHQYCYVIDATSINEIMLGPYFVITSYDTVRTDNGLSTAQSGTATFIANSTENLKGFLVRFDAESFTDFQEIATLEGIDGKYLPLTGGSVSNDLRILNGKSLIVSPYQTASSDNISYHTTGRVYIDKEWERLMVECRAGATTDTDGRVSYKGGFIRMTATDIQFGYHEANEYRGRVVETTSKSYRVCKDGIYPYQSNVDLGSRSYKWRNLYLSGDIQAATFNQKKLEDLISSNPNLLVNPDFKANLRGKTVYSGYTYTVDGWIKLSEGTVIIEDDGVTLNNANGTKPMYWGQILDLNLANMPITLSTIDSDGNLYEISGDAPTVSDNPLKVLIADIGSFYVDLTDDHYDYFFQINAGKSIKIRWAKLEFGSVATRFVPSNRVEEALKCPPLENAERQLFYGNGKWAECPPNPNLLLNSDFKNNQSGLNEYVSLNIGIDTLDNCWLHRGTLKVLDSGVNFVSESGAFYKRFVTKTNQTVAVGDTVTISMVAKVNQVSGIVQFRIMNSDTLYGDRTLMISNVTEGYETFSATITSPTHYEHVGVEILVGNTENDSVDIDIRHWKLEFGSVATRFVIPNHTTWEGALSNPNLLDNPDFKINQRGETSYNDVGYMVDRWRTFDSKAKLQVVDDGIKITILTPPNKDENVNSLFQIFDHPVDVYNGKQFTLSLKAKNIIGPWRVGIRFGKTFPSGDFVTVIYKPISSGVNRWTFTIPDQAASMRIGIIQHGPDGGMIDDTVTIEWVKLELGAIATPFIPPNSTIELIKCQRYLVKLTGDIVKNYTANSNAFYFMVPLSTPLRISPTINNTNNLEIKKYGTGETHTGFIYNTMTKSSPPSVVITATKNSHGIETSVGGMLMVPSGKSVLLSAEL